MGKVKKEKQQSADDTVGDVSIKEEDTYDDKLKHCSIIAQPMAPKKLTKKCLKLIKKGENSDNRASIEHFMKLMDLVYIFNFSIEAKDVLTKWFERCAKSIEERRNRVSSEFGRMPIESLSMVEMELSISLRFLFQDCYVRR